MEIKGEPEITKCSVSFCLDCAFVAAEAAVPIFMSVRCPVSALIVSCPLQKSDTDFTKVTFRPDLSRFGLNALDKDHVALLTRRVWDVAATLKKVKVSLNGKRIPVRKFKDYVDKVMSDQYVHQARWLWNEN
jgi:hypothetical protein